MRTLYIAAILTAVASAQAGAQIAPEHMKAEDAIRYTIESYATAWSNHDAVTLANLYTVDADYTGFGSVMTRGRAEIEKLYAELFAGTYNATRLTTTVSSIRFLKPDVAIVDGTLDLTGLPATTGTDTSAPGLYIAIMTKDGTSANWLLTTMWSKRLAALPSSSAPK